MYSCWFRLLLEIINILSDLLHDQEWLWGLLSLSNEWQTMLNQKHMAHTAYTRTQAL